MEKVSRHLEYLIVDFLLPLKKQVRFSIQIHIDNSLPRQLAGEQTNTIWDLRRQFEVEEAVWKN